jgi:GT2 family glycosyltransferase
MTISVIIPTRRPALVVQLLESLRAQVFDHSFEIILVDDNATKSLERLAFRTDRCECKVLAGGGRGPAQARNLGVKHATGTYLLFLDDDSIVEACYLGRILKELEARPNHAVAGVQVATSPRNPFSLTSEWLLRLFIEDETIASSRSKFAASNGLALRRKDFDGCGGFDPYFPLAAGEDREFCDRWIATGFQIAVSKELTVEHHFPESFAALLQQQWRYGRGRVHYERRGRRSPRLRSARFYIRMIAAPGFHYGLGKGALVGILAWLSQGAIACGYVRERIRWWPQVLPGVVKAQVARTK